MSRDDEIRELIKLHNKRLFELKKQQAIYGISAEPRLAIEIETIEGELDALGQELNALGSQRRSGPRLPILIVEDEKVWQEILQDCLVELGHPIEVAGDFAEARDKLQTGQFSLITLDAHLRSETPAHEGILLLDYIRNRFGPDLPVIVISGTIDKRDLVRAFKKFAVTDVFLKEHFAFDEFSAAVQDVINASRV